MPTSKPKRPFYGNQHLTPDQRVERARAAELQAVRGPTNRQIYFEKVGKGVPVPPSPLLAEIGDNRHAIQKSETNEVPLRNGPEAGAGVRGQNQELQDAAGNSEKPQSQS